MKNQFNIIKSALPKTTNVPSVQNILLSGGTLTATDLEMLITVPIESDLNALLPPKTVEIVNAVDAVDLELHEQTLHIKSGRGKFKLSCDTGIDDYPAPWHITDLTEVHAENFISALRSVLFAVSKEETRPAFMCVLMECKDKHLQLMASDTYRLAIAGTKAEADDFRVLVPPKVLRELSRLNPSKLELGFTDSAVTFKADDVLLSSRLLNENYPDVSSVIPKESKTTVTATQEGLSEPLAEMVKRASLIAEGKNKAIELSVVDGTLTVKAQGLDGTMEESLKVRHTGEDVTLYVNADYFGDVLKYQGLEIKLHGEQGAVVVERPGYDYLYLLLPVKKVN